MGCAFCGSSSVLPFYDQNMPLHVYALPQERVNENKLFPLRVSVCKKCGLGFYTSRLTDEQLTDIYDNYVCIDPFSNIGHTKFTPIVKIIEKHVSKNAGVVEIGCANGYLLLTLRNNGYTNLQGVEPSHEADVAISHGLHVKKSYFTKDSFEHVDLFLMSHVFEHFTDPFVIFGHMVKQLADSGKIIIETPNFGGFQHQHLFYYSPVFYRYMAEKFSVFLIDIHTEEDFVIAVFAKQGKHCEMTESVEDVIKKAKSIQNNQAGRKEYFENILKKHKKLHIWGTGSMLLRDICQISPELLDNNEIVLLDSQKSREGQYVMGVKTPVQHSLSIAGSHIDAVLIASQFEAEIKDAMVQNGIAADHIYSLYSKNKL